MGYSLKQFSTDCHNILAADSGPKGLEKVRVALERALVDPEFVAENIGPDEDSPRKLLYQDPDLDFCIFAHVRGNKAVSPPHDHGRTWAIYGQVSGVTEMTLWKKLSEPKDGKPGTVEALEVYDLKPGMARTYDVGVLHSPSRDLPTRLIRIEGRNMDHEPKRDRYVEVETAA
jgi:predicted metal-dependent enzyme (double-stranded beta helix superfamily)